MERNSGSIPLKIMDEPNWPVMAVPWINCFSLLSVRWMIALVDAVTITSSGLSLMFSYMPKTRPFAVAISLHDFVIVLCWNSPKTRRVTLDTLFDNIFHLIFTADVSTQFSASPNAIMRTIDAFSFRLLWLFGSSFEYCLHSRSVKVKDHFSSTITFIADECRLWMFHRTATVIQRSSEFPSEQAELFIYFTVFGHSNKLRFERCCQTAAYSTLSKNVDAQNSQFILWNK